ncbi:sugar ABC transporter permease [Paenarthrobacter sp. DKR-5]|uniref:carbohydrate ABC transporter permease n=1 Tax=Paenarthrobacter sp. DKR-5 TaxID=2835535 RepID=UPI001BDD653A|nr:sugar ABC transporter permease [Paenarthrobacter sp. DKR-5]MBT1002269.1 sugar ABC transporter permease [Paenarthrobacter sp. DKR-5]
MSTANAATARRAADIVAQEPAARKRRPIKSFYPTWFFLPAIVLYVVFFVIPSFSSFYFSLTRWSLFDAQFIGFENFVQFFRDPQLYTSFIHTLIYAALTSGSKVILGFFLALLLTSPILGRGYLRAVIFFPVLLSTIGVGIMFKSLLDPFHGMVNAVLGFFGLPQPGWFTDPNLALYTIAGVDIWKGVGIATLIFMAGIVAIPNEYFEAARIDGASSWKTIRLITIPLSKGATATVIILSLIGGLRSFDIIWATTGGGPGFTSDVLASVIYKQYQAGFYGLSTAGNVVLFLLVTVIMVPLSYFLNRKPVEL